MAQLTTVPKRGAADPTTLRDAFAAGKKVPPDATMLLTQDHREAEGFFDWYEAAPDQATRAVVVRKLCSALRAHMKAEEEIFYPAAREATGDDDLVDHGIEEHDEAKAMVQRIEADPQDAETVRKLRAAIEEHIGDEENELFPKVRETSLDLYELGAQVAARKVETLRELAA